MDIGLPVFGFDECGGYRDIVNDNSGALIAYPDIEQYKQKIMEILENEERVVEIREFNLLYAGENFGYEQYMKKLLALLSGRKPYMPLVEIENQQLPSVSVIIPNYNYAEYLDLRLRTVLNQSVRPTQIIILDDASTDESMDIIQSVEGMDGVDVRVITNDVNSGSVFSQWKKGLQVVTGDLVWIAETDDYCDQNFIESLIPEFDDPEAVIAFTNSIMVDRYGGSYGATYTNYYKEHFGSYFDSDFRADGTSFIRDVLLKRNAIMNASSVLFRATAATDAQIYLENFKVSGDWLFWINICLKGKICYQTKARNYHRRHEKSVIAVALENKSVIVNEMISLCKHIVEKVKPILGPDCLEKSIVSIEKTYSELFKGEDCPADIREHSEFSSGFKQICQPLLCPLRSPTSLNSIPNIGNS